MDDFTFAARGVVGSRDETIAGHVPVGMLGIRLTQAGFARNVEKPGSKRSAYNVSCGRDTTTGTYGKKVREGNSVTGENHAMVHHILVLIFFLFAPGVAIGQFG